MQINRLAECVALQSRYFTTYHPEPRAVPHIIITGVVRDAGNLRELLNELYHYSRLATLPGQSADAATSRVTVIFGTVRTEAARRVHCSYFRVNVMLFDRYFAPVTAPSSRAYRLNL